jgi:hypothetical protein
MISGPRHEAEVYLSGVPRLGISGAVPLFFMVSGERILIYPYLIVLSVTSMALNVRMTGK